MKIAVNQISGANLQAAHFDFLAKIEGVGVCMRNRNISGKHLEADLTDFWDVANRAVADSTLRTYSIGSCYARTRAYPNGVYWMVLLFY